MAQDLRPEKGQYIGAELRAPAQFRLAYQTEDFGRRSFVDCPVALDAIPNARLTAVFAHRQDGDQWFHWGDLWFDVDDKDLRKSAKTAAAIINVLVGLGVPVESIHCYQSGGKGYHIRVPIEVFGPAAHELMHCLPTACQAFTQYIVEAISADDADGTGHATVDLAVCAARTGQMLRRVNVLRENSFYKVPVSHDEVRAVRDAVDAVAAYRALCSAPRDENWKAEVNEVAGLGDLLKRLALEAVEKQEARVKAAKARHTEPVDADEILGMKICDNVAGAIRHVWPCGGSILQTWGKYKEWSDGARIFDYIAGVHDCWDYAEQMFRELSREAPNYSGMAAVTKRWNDSNHDNTHKHLTELSIFEKVKGKGYRDLNPTGRGTFKSPRNARDVLADVVAEPDKAKQRAMLLDDLTVAALEACDLSGWRELTTQVKVLAKEHHVKRELDGLLKEFKSESGNQTDDDLKSDAKFLKWIKTVATFCIDTDGLEVVIIGKNAYELSGGAWLSALADVWLTTTGGESGGVDRAFPSRLAAESVMTFKAMARASEKAPVTRGERKIIYGGFVYLDAHHKIYKIGPGGWCELSELPDGLYFKRNPDDLPMPKPLAVSQRTGASLLESVGKLVHVANIDASMCPLIAAIITFFWCHETGNYIWLITGEPGVGKTTLILALRRFTHPSRKAADSLSRKQPDFLALAKQSDMLALDNCDHITPEISDAMCQLSTSPKSTQISARALYSNHDTVGVPCGKLIAMTGITDPGSRGDYLTRSIRIEAVKRSGGMLLESEIIEAQEKHESEIMGALLDVAAGAMLKVKSYGPDHPLRSPDLISRMVSADLWVIATFETLGLTTKDAVQMLRSLRNGVALEAVSGHPVLGLLMRLEQPIQGTTEEISKELLKLRGWRFIDPPTGWPTVNSLARMLKLQKGSLEKAGFKMIIDADPKGKKSTVWRIEPREE